MLVAGVDESLIPEPEKPQAANEDSGDTESQKVYLRKVAERVKQLKIGRQRAAALNESFSRWYYIISEDTVARLRPELKGTGL